MLRNFILKEEMLKGFGSQIHQHFLQPKKEEIRIYELKLQQQLCFVLGQQNRK